MKKIYRKISAVAAALSMTFSVNAFANNWVHDNGTFKYIQADGTYATGWTWIDNDLDGYAACYYFDENGILFHDFQDKIDDKWLNSNGEWVIDGVTQRKKVSEPYSIPFGTEPYNPAQPLKNCIDAWDLRQVNPLSPEQNPRYHWHESSKYYRSDSLTYVYDKPILAMLTGEDPNVSPYPARKATYEWLVNWLNGFDFMNMSEEERYNEIVKVLHTITIDPEAKSSEQGEIWEKSDPFDPNTIDDDFYYRTLINKRSDVAGVLFTTELLCKVLGLVCDVDYLDHDTWIRTGNEWHYISYGNDDSKHAVASSEAGLYTRRAAGKSYETRYYLFKKFIERHGGSYDLEDEYFTNIAK
ncbi:hypothetical protein [Oribacterium sp. FC2011]|uniref:hypothetical protein n=1 Tax=Oribacterium sp. FC2011 TaxID=1408311 RepID=UPI0004E25317|nr:hypothetical protein [Oribacterium sp. FC2011]